MEKRNTRIILLTLFLSLGLGLLVVLSGLIENSLDVRKNALKISGIYGETIPLTEIHTVALVDEGPTLSRRTNGYSLGFRKKGYFTNAQGEKLKLIINSNVKPWILIIKSNGQKIYYSSGKEDNQRIYQVLIKSLPKKGNS